MAPISRTTFAIAAAGALTTTLVAAPQAAAQDAGSLSWAVRDSFNGYIGSPIAGGSIDTDEGATFNDEVFAFPVVSATAERVDFGGSVRWTGHGGVLDIEISDLKLHDENDGTGYFTVDYSTLPLDGDTAELMSATFGSSAAESAEGDYVTGDDVRFIDVTFDADPDFSGAGEVAGSTVLTEAGEIIFGNYAAGDAFDDFSLDLSGEATGGNTAETGEDDDAELAADATSTDPDALGQVTGIVALIAAIGGILAVLGGFVTIPGLELPF